MYEYKAKILRIVDGDTVDVDIDLGFGISLNRERVRMMGIDTPESRTRDLTEKAFGLAAKERLKDLLPIGSTARLKTEIDKSGEDKKGKFGRILGDFYVYYDIKDTEVGVWLRTEFGRKSTLDVASFIGNCALLLPRFQFFLSRLLIIRSLR